jgi:hypothetical protein
MNNTTPGCLRLVMPLAGKSARLQTLLHFGLACANQVKKMGGCAKCFSVPDFVIVEMSRVSRDQIEPLVNCLGESPSMKEATLNLIIEERAIPEMDLESPKILRGEFANERLTKAFLLELPNGAIVVGNGLRNGKPNFFSRLHEGNDRTRLWKRAVTAGAAQLTCHVYWNPKDVLEIHGVDPEDDMDDDFEGPIPNPCVR